MILRPSQALESKNKDGPKPAVLNQKTVTAAAKESVNNNNNNKVR